MKKQEVVDKLIAKAAYQQARGIANTGCIWFFYQPKLSEKLKKLRKF